MLADVIEGLLEQLDALIDHLWPQPAPVRVPVTVERGPR